jgi:hypothetical protein
VAPSNEGLNAPRSLARTMVDRNFSADEWRLYFTSEKYRKTFDEYPNTKRRREWNAKKQLRERAKYFAKKIT